MMATKKTLRGLLAQAQPMDFSNGKAVNRIPKIYHTVGYDRKVKCEDMFTITASNDIYTAAKTIFEESDLMMQEHFKVFMLNRANKIVGVYEASKGGYTGTVADPRLIMATALQCLAVSIVLMHNHPSGNNKPSIADQELTLKIKEAAKYFDIKVMDHLIVTEESYFSFADEGMI